MKDFSRWSKEEIKTLFKFVEIKKSEGMPLIQIFFNYAQATKRHTNSVRNYYYKELSLMQNNVDFAKELNINLDNHEVVRGIPFSKEEQTKMLEQIEKLLSQGFSVRKACLKLADGDASKMIRLQNKYRAIVKQKGENNSMGEIIKMPQNKTGLSDEDVKALFMGLIKLVKKQEYENAKLTLKGELFDANEKLKDAMAKLAVKENLISKLKEQIVLVKNQLDTQKQESIKRRVNSVSKTKSASSLVREYFKQTNLAVNKAEN